METPILNQLERYNNQSRISFAMPGHKNMRGLVANLSMCDVTELSSTLNLLGDDITITRANELLSEFYSTKKSYILTGGSTAGVKVMILSAVNPGETLAISPDCHMSVINTCAISGIDVKVITDINDITPDVSAVLVTSPNYYGQTKDIPNLSEKCHSLNIPLLVDEAHGAHFIGKYGLPKSATVLGADLVCQSAHKTLNALTGAAYLHICSDSIRLNRVRTMLHAVHTSSPSYMIAASADIARATLSECDYSEIIKECCEFKNAICRQTKIKALENDDPTRIVLDFSEYSISGFSVSEKLAERYMIDVEMADLKNIVLIVTPYNRHSDFMSLFHALKEIVTDINQPIIPDIAAPVIKTRTISPRKGMYKNTELVELSRAVGRIAAVSVCIYPPGSAVICMGEEITKDAVEYIEAVLKESADVVGITDGKIDVV